MAYGKIVGGVLIQKDPSPSHGFVGIPEDAICGQVTSDGGKTFSNPPPPPLTVKDCHDALYRHIDSLAQADGWDSRITFMQRAAFPGHWQQAAIEFCKRVDACEIFALGLLAEVQAGEKPAPQDEAAFLALLPPFNL